MVPIIDFLGEPFLDGCFGLVNERFLVAAHFVQVRRDEVQGGILQNLRLKLLPQPHRFRHLGEQGQFVRVQRSVVEVRGVTSGGRAALVVDFHELHLLGNDTAVPSAIHAGILDRVFQVDERADFLAHIGFIDQHCTRFNRSRFRSIMRSMVDSSSG